MAPAIVHFTAGFVTVLGVLWLLPITRYRLTGAFLGGIWGMAPDVHHILDGSLRGRIENLHDSAAADVFAFHYTFDQPFFRAHSIELTFLSVAALGIAFLLYDWRFGRRTPTGRLFETADSSERDHDL